MWHVILLFFAHLLHIRDITDDVQRCAEMAGAGRNVEWIVSQKGNEKLVVDHYLFAMETESLGMWMFGIARAIQAFDGPDSDCPDTDHGCD